MFRKILVPLDGSAFGEHALPLAVSIARRSGGSLELVQVMPLINPMYTELPIYVDSATEARILEQQRVVARSYLADVTRRLNQVAPDLPVSSKLLEGEIESTIRKRVAETNIDLVLLTTHGRGPLSRFWLGSVADDLVRHLSVPTLLVRPLENPVDFEPEVTLKHILIPLDGEPLAEKMIDPALELGRLMQADYTLLRVVKPVLATLSLPMAGADLGEVTEAVLEHGKKLERQRMEEAQAYLEKVAKPLRDKGLTVITRVEVEESPARAILAHAKEFDLIALETHGRGGLARLFMGSIADQVIRGRTVPVLVHRANVNKG